MIIGCGRTNLSARWHSTWLNLKKLEGMLVQKYVLRFDNEACWGCKTCEVACKQENEARDGIKLICVTEDGPGENAGMLNFLYQVSFCRHCENPPCAETCPVEAISKKDDGIVILDEASCSGCKACVEACPYHAITFDNQGGIAQKCNLCSHRVHNGLMPACADNVCPAHCIHFGAPGDIENILTEKAKNRNNSA